MKLNIEFNIKIGNINLYVHDQRLSAPWMQIATNELNLNFKKF